jgi:dTMP kinase
MHAEGTFIVFEGCDGTGKSTNIARMARCLRDNGFAPLTTREPGGTPIGEQVRSILLDRKNSGMSMLAEALLYAASRAQLVSEVIMPALNRGDVVVCERYFYSSIAYQAAAGGLDPGFVRAINEWATQGVLPDVVILLDMDPEASLHRRYTGRDRIETRRLEYHRAVRNAYLRLAESDRRFRVIDASRSEEDVYRDVIAAVKGLLVMPGRAGREQPG